MEIKIINLRIGIRIKLIIKIVNLQNKNRTRMDPNSPSRTRTLAVLTQARLQLRKHWKSLHVDRNGGQNPST
jgi:hypothetical protein